MLIEAERPIAYRGTPVVAAPPDPAPISLHTINGLRGPGAIAIAFAHFCVVVDFIPYRAFAPIALLVDLFFVFSGLVIAQAYTEKLSRASAIPEYIIRRFGRIWPVHAMLLGLLVGYELTKLMAQAFLGKQFSAPPFAPDGINLVQAIWSNLLLVQSLGIHDRETWNFPSWSLSVELATYAVFAAYCLARPFTRRIASLATIALSLAILVLVAPSHMRSTFDYGIFRCLAGFFAGTLCYDVVRSWRLPTWPLPTLVELLAIVLVVFWLCRSSDGYLTFAAPLFFSLFVMAFIQGRGLISAVLKSKPLQVLAELSFAIYMVHAVILVVFLALFHAYEGHTGHHLFTRVVNPLAGHPGAAPTVQVVQIGGGSVIAALVVAYMASVLAAAYGAYRLVEVPGRAMFGALAKRLRLGPSRRLTPLHQRVERAS